MAPFAGNWTLNARRTLRTEDVQRLIDAARLAGAREHLITVLGYNLALLVSEIVHLKVSDFDFTRRNVTIIPLRKASGEDAVPYTVSYPLVEPLPMLVKGWINRSRLGGDSWLFPGRSGICRLQKYPCIGHHLTRRQTQRVFDRLARGIQLKLPGRGIHALRHARLTQVARATRDPWLVRDVGRLESVVHGQCYVDFVKMAEYIEHVGAKL